MDQLPGDDDNDPNNGLPNFASASIQTRRDIDTMLRIMLDTAPNDPSLLPGAKRPKFLTNHLTLSSKVLLFIIQSSDHLWSSDSLYSAEITEAAARSNFPSIGQRNHPIVLQYPSIIVPINEHQSTMTTPLTPQNGHPPSHSGKMTRQLHGEIFLSFRNTR